MTSAQVLSHFREIMTIPRESGHEEHIIAYLQKFAADRGMDCRTDEAGNVLITIPATPGRENAPTLIDGWLIAKDTTLGADCGIGIAAQLAVLEDKELPHGRIECLFTTSEETGLDGAFALKPDFLTGSILLNLDSEDEGELFIGCAGGIDTTAKFHYTPVPVPAGKVCVKAGFCGGIGGHSGDDIDKGRSNAVQSLARLLFRVWSEIPAVLCSIDGGNKRNAIAREASAVIAVNPGDAFTVKNILEEILAELKDEYSVTDPDIASVWEESLPVPSEAIDDSTAFNLIRALHAVPHGVMAMSAEVKGLVETSSNLASVKMQEGSIIRVGTSQRSSTNSARRNAASRQRSRSRSHPRVRVPRLEAQPEVPHPRGLQGLLPPPLRQGSRSTGHPRRTGMRTVLRQIPSFRHDILRSHPPRSPRSRRETGPGQPGPLRPAARGRHQRMQIILRP